GGPPPPAAVQLRSAPGRGLLGLGARVAGPPGPLERGRGVGVSVGNRATGQPVGTTAAPHPEAVAAALRLSAPEEEPRMRPSLWFGLAALCLFAGAFRTSFSRAEAPRPASKGGTAIHFSQEVTADG